MIYMMCFPWDGWQSVPMVTPGMMMFPGTAGKCFLGNTCLLSDIIGNVWWCFTHWPSINPLLGIHTYLFLVPPLRLFLFLYSESHLSYVIYVIYLLIAFRKVVNYMYILAEVSCYDCMDTVLEAVMIALPQGRILRSQCSHSAGAACVPLWQAHSRFYDCRRTLHSEISHPRQWMAVRLWAGNIYSLPQRVYNAGSWRNVASELCMLLQCPWERKLEITTKQALLSAYSEYIPTVPLPSNFNHVNLKGFFFLNKQVTQNIEATLLL